MRLALGQIVGVNIDDVTADGLGREEAEREVLVFRVQRQALLVDGALIDGVRAGVVDDFAAEGEMGREVV